MGKTKLIQEYAHRQKGNVECMRILCMKSIQEDPPDFEKHYDNKLILGENAVLKETDVNAIRRQLSVFENTCKKDKVVFFFDEAQMLCSNQSNAAYHTVLWWLRQDRDEHYVGVFVGTLLGLSSYQVLGDPSGFSRDGQKSYKNYNSQSGEGVTEEKLLLYDPFYTLTTISLARCDNKKDDDVVDELKDIRKHGWNGRPLFAAMLRRQTPGLPPALTLSDENVSDGVIHNPTMYNILLRVLLSPNPTNWSSNDDSIASVLGTRVQLGLANYDFVNSAISRGYAMLVRYDTPRSDSQDQRKSYGSVVIVFPPDPVCAALAMGMMQPGWELKQGANVKSRIQGQEPKFLG
jgi:hypothetical protein